MKAKLYKNIDMVQINIQQGVTEYQLPKNVDWAKECIEKVVLLAPSANIVSPVDGQTHVLTRTELQDVFVDLYAGDDSEIALNLAVENIMHTCNYPVEVNNKLQLNLSRITFMQTPKKDACMLLYIFYGGETCPDYEPSRKSVTIEFPLQANERLRFREIIDRYMYADGHKVRGIVVWAAEQQPMYMHLQDKKVSYVMRNVYGALCRPEMLGATAEQTQVHPFRLMDSDIDFENSYVREASGTAHKQTITFEF